MRRSPVTLLLISVMMLSSCNMAELLLASPNRPVESMQSVHSGSHLLHGNGSLNELTRYTAMQAITEA